MGIASPCCGNENALTLWFDDLDTGQFRLTKWRFHPKRHNANLRLSLTQFGTSAQNTHEVEEWILPVVRRAIDYYKHR